MFKMSLVVISAIFIMAGCGVSPDVEEGQAAQALSADFVDGSGMVTVRIKTCPGTTVASHNTTTCAVDGDFVLIGGGAEVVGELDPGALLTASYPADLTTWVASSKDQVLFYAHRLNAYSIGLRLAGVSSATLASLLRRVPVSSSSAEHPSIASPAPAGFTLIGGGAQAHWISSGQLLTTSAPRGAQWAAASKDHILPEAGTVDAFAIAVPTSIPGFGSLDVMPLQVTTSVPLTGYGTANLGVPAGWVLASIGGSATYTSEGRMLTDLIPFVDAPANLTPGATVRSKDHDKADSGSTTAYVLAIRKH